MTSLPISDDDIRSIARLARLDMPDEEIAAERVHINELLERFQSLQQLDLDGVEPTSHCVALVNVLRDDQAIESLPRDDALRNAPQARDGCFIVPRILGD
jgi:aspartyl-tRNA(Asn)/glutamyl-tRNA(Gln) amidotransferase subunit C